MTKHLTLFAAVLIHVASCSDPVKSEGDLFLRHRGLGVVNLASGNLSYPEEIQDVWIQFADRSSCIDTANGLLFVDDRLTKSTTMLAVDQEGLSVEKTTPGVRPIAHIQSLFSFRFLTYPRWQVLAREINEDNSLGEPSIIGEVEGSPTRAFKAEGRAWFVLASMEVFSISDDWRIEKHVFDRNFTPAGSFGEGKLIGRRRVDRGKGKRPIFHVAIVDLSSGEISDFEHSLSDKSQPWHVVSLLPHFDRIWLALELYGTGEQFTAEFDLSGKYIRRVSHALLNSNHVAPRLTTIRDEQS